MTTHDRLLGYERARIEIVALLMRRRDREPLASGATTLLLAVEEIALMIPPAWCSERKPGPDANGGPK